MNSMTGYGRAKLEQGSREYLVEIKSVNHKYADITVKGPRNLLYLEDKIRKSVLNKVKRGKIDIYITYINSGIETKNVSLNKELAKTYIEELKQLAKEASIDSEIKVTEISKFPDVLNIKNEEDDEDLIWDELSKCLDIAIENFLSMRKAEGEKIRQDLSQRIKSVEKIVDEISNLSTGLVEEYIVKLEKRIEEILKVDVDQARLAQEVVFYSDKCSVEEELTRLKSHISQFEKMLNEEENGKKMDFLMQEMNREANTIGSKSANLKITNLVVELKTLLEDIREQIQNIE